MRTKIRKRLIYSALTCLLASGLFVFGLNIQGRAEEQSSESYTYKDLWIGGEGITITDNVEVPIYAQEGWISTGNENGVEQGKFVQAEDIPAWRKNGVKISTTTESSIVWYANEVDISGFTKEDHLIDIMPLATTRNISRDFSGLKIYLQDALDENNWLTINFRALSLMYYPGTYMSVSTSTGFTGGYRWGINHMFEENFPEHESGHGGFYNVNGAPADKTRMEMLFTPMSIRYDIREHVILFTSDDRSFSYILDLEDTATMGEGREWKGFTDDRIRIGVQALGIESSPAEYLILNVANHGMNGTQIVDTESPYHVDLHEGEELPVAMVGKPYKVLETEFYDFYDGKLDYAVSYKKITDNQYTSITEDYFIPTSAGEYLLKYEAKDREGNVDSFEYKITAKNRVDIQPLIIEVESSSISAKIGERIEIPQATVKGGSGKVDLECKVVYLSDNSEIDISKGYFIPYFAGDYSIVFTAKDYVGEIYQTYVNCSVYTQYAPVFEQETTMYERFVDGVKVCLPKMNVYDYVSVPGHCISAETEITVRGTGDKASYAQTVQNYLFTPDSTLFGEQVIIEYKVYCRSYPAYAQMRTYTVDIIKPQYVWEYFTHDEGLAIGYNQKDEEEKYISFSAQADMDVAEIKPINPLRAEDLELQFAFEEGKSKLDYFEIELYDWQNNERKVQLKIQEYSDNKTAVYYEGRYALISGGMSAGATLILKYKNGAFLDYLGNTLFMLDDFNGFESGKVWVKLRMVSAETGTMVKLKKVGVQSLGADYRSSGMTTFKDTVAPEIEVLGKLPAEALFNQSIKIPQIKAYDWCSFYMTFGVVILAPDDSTVYQGALADDLNLKVTQHGVYTIIYEVTDDAGNKQSLRHSISVEDKSQPVIIYQGETTREVSLGKKVKFDKVYAYDNLDVDLPIYVYIIKKNGQFVSISDSYTYTFEEKGKYTLRYCTVDDAYNYSWIDVTIWVK